MRWLIEKCAQVLTQTQIHLHSCQSFFDHIPSPVSEEEAVLDEDVEGKVDEALGSHEGHVLPQEVPAEGVQAEGLP